MQVPKPTQAAVKVKTQPQNARQEKKNGFKLAMVAATVTARQTKVAIRFTQTKKAVGMIGVPPKVPE